jgi:hypothetical protein
LFPNLSALGSEPAELLRHSRVALCEAAAGTKFRVLARTNLAKDNASQLQAITSLLDIVRALRNLAATAGIRDEELNWALAAQFLAWVKFAPPEQPWTALLPYLASAWHLAQAQAIA